MIKINEIFGPTIQGEGKSINKKVTFIRTSLCNLFCIWCDTPYTWNWEGTRFEHPQKYSKLKEIHTMSVKDIFDKVESIGVKAVVLSGGEPMVQQKQLIPLLQKLKSKDYWIEVETNGTITPLKEFSRLVDQFNCSPKLSNSKVDLKLREKPKALLALSLNPKTNFKFVVGNENDMNEIFVIVKKYYMREVYLMPLGKTNIELAETRAMVRTLAQNSDLYRFTDRLHITLLGGGRAI